MYNMIVLLCRQLLGNALCYMIMRYVRSNYYFSGTTSITAVHMFIVHASILSIL